MTFLVAAGLVAALYAPAASAHGIVTKITAGGKTFDGYDPSFQYQPSPPAVAGWTAPSTQSRGPVTSDKVASEDMICAAGATPGKAYVDVQAGQDVTVQWTDWPDSHHGPMIDYLASCNGECTTVDKNQLKFFKIDGVGMVSTDGVCWKPPLSILSPFSSLVLVIVVFGGSYVMNRFPPSMVMIR